ncbi:MAG: 7,8-dihydro-8-oxoguanine triphosphatase [Deltaproteobacteria bacterium]|nr:MAG: 7,8-dihydro-8-oxoguanine triphosphatase [Deltaproteobacteria bacterium]
MMYTPILATLGYVLSEDGKRVLLVHRNKRQNDQHLGKYNGLGGKMLASEDALTCLRREIREEANIECRDVELRGTINWTGFGPEGEDWFCFLFLITRYEGTPLQANEEGDLVWIELERLAELPMWEGDRFFLPLIFDGNPKVFYGYMPYESNVPVAWNYTRI